MNFSLKALALLGLAGLSTIQAATTSQTGDNCPITSDLICTLDNGRPCEDLATQSIADCGLKNLNFAYSYCNNNANTNNANNVLLFEAKTVALIDQQVVTEDFDRSTWSPGCRQPRPVVRQVDSCDKDKISASIKVEGKIEDPNNRGYPLEGENNYCYAYTWLRIYMRKIKEDPPTASPVVVSGEPLVPTAAPFVVPDELWFAPFTLDMECNVESSPGSGVFSMPCSFLARSPPASLAQCEVNVEIKYTITNYGRAARLQAIIDEESKNLLVGATMNSYLVPTYGSWTDVKEETINLCELAGERITKTAYAIAASVPGGIPGYASAGVTFDLP